ncbi:hypothetical protein BDN72DRAFT_833084 [Pluteus cervinus]|uniref:Uncharacterized protein n=1 Tax=Pluteus cervinus TaxID=181527 RepID=A0ACD3BC53_9AGAR|nr:hypothetical protein BDN72DRAFT_833084 [Pluteus cervinus]
MLSSRLQHFKFNTPARFSSHIRAFSAAQRKPPGSSSSSGNKPNNAEPEFISTERKTAFVRAWNFIESPAHAFAIVRAVEEKYGPVEEFKFPRDFEIPSKYQSRGWIVFKDPKSFERIPPNSEVLHIPAPDVDPDQPGGISLNELLPLLEPRKRMQLRQDKPLADFSNFMGDILEHAEETEASRNKSGKTISFRIERARSEHYTKGEDMPPSPPPEHVQRQFSEAFVNWGGFYKLKPIPSSTVITDEELFGESKLDHVRMRRALRKHAQLLGVPSPYEYDDSVEQGGDGAQEPVREVKKSEDEKPVEWEPLPGAEDDEGVLPRRKK